MKTHRFNKYYRVFKNDTTVTEVSSNDFKPVKFQDLKKFTLQDHSLNNQIPFSHADYFLVADADMYYDYENKVHAMGKAKEGALKYIELLISEGGQSISKLYQYRFDHYEDLTINLLDSAIRRIEKT